MSVTTRPRIDEDIQSALGTCQQALAPIHGEMTGKLGLEADRWFDLLQAVPASRTAMVRLRRLGRKLPPGHIGHYALLQAFMVSLPMVAALPAEEWIKHQICTLARQVAFPPKGWERHFALDGEPFKEMAKIATLRRLPAGQLTFDIENLPRSWLMKIHPLDLPTVLREVLTGMGGFGPVAVPHLCHWRPNPLVMLRAESERSLWRIAKSLETLPKVKGLAAASWFYASEVGQAFPHLSWLRDFFVEQGATVVDMEPAPLDSGFLVGSAKRRQLHEAGHFHPRRALVLWRREDMLDWAAAHPELGESPEPAILLRPVPPVAPPRRVVAQRRIASGRHTLLNGIKLLNHNPKLYILLTLLLPALAVTLATSAALGGWAAAPTFCLTAALLWVAQYFLLQ